MNPNWWFLIAPAAMAVAFWAALRGGDKHADDLNRPGVDDA